jgi:hypothetical protein
MTYAGCKFFTFLHIVGPWDQNYERKVRSFEKNESSVRTGWEEKRLSPKSVRELLLAVVPVQIIVRHHTSNDVKRDFCQFRPSVTPDAFQCALIVEGTVTDHYILSVMRQSIEVPLLSGGRKCANFCHSLVPNLAPNRSRLWELPKVPWMFKMEERIDWKSWDERLWEMWSRSSCETSFCCLWILWT